MSEFYSQKDRRYATKYIGRSWTTFRSSGCLICSLSNLDTLLHGSQGRDPKTLNLLFIIDKCFSVDIPAMLDVAKAAKSMGYKYLSTTRKPNRYCIAETNAYAPAVKQHFFVLNPLTAMILDPLDIEVKWKKKPSNYKIVSSFRVLNGYNA